MNIYFSEREEPPDQFAYKVYLAFIDEEHFTFWRTHENPPEVLTKLNYYLKEHPGSDLPTKYKRVGDTLTGMREMRWSAPDVRSNTHFQRFTGKFTDFGLEIRQESWTSFDDGEQGKVFVHLWRMKPLSF